MIVPIESQLKERRVIKFSYEEHQFEPQWQLLQKFRKGSDSNQRSRRFAALEDRLEGLPSNANQSEWEARYGMSRTPATISLFDKVLRGIAWRTHLVGIEAPAIGEGGSYHLELQAPEGLQIRRAVLSAHQDGATTDTYAVRGARGLQRVHTYLGGLHPGSGGIAVFSFKPRTSTIVRSAATLSLASVALMVVTNVWLEAIAAATIERPLAALYLLVPSLAGASIARSGEHPMTTSVVYGLRIMTVLIATVPFLMAASLMLITDCGVLGKVSALLTTVSVVLSAVVLVSWRLTGRRRPGGISP